MSEADELHALVGGRLRAVVAPRLDAYELRRLLLVAGCIAVAAATTYAPSALPQRAPVALGAAVLGILLVLRRRPTASAAPPARAEPVEEAPALTDAAPEPAADMTPKPRRSRLGRGTPADLVALAVSVASHESELDAHEARLVSISGRQSLIQVDTRDRLTDFATRLEHVEARLTEAEAATTRLRAQHLETLRQFAAALAETVRLASDRHEP